MKINQSNIEAYLLDYLEGNLNPMHTAELMAFLTEHPEYEKSMPSLDFLLPVAENARFVDKESLKKDFSDIPEVNAGNFEEFCIAYSEKLLLQSDIIRLFRYIGNDPKKQNILHLYSTLKITPDKQIVFKQKSQLKKPIPFSANRTRLYFAISIAALFVLIFLILIPRKPSDTHPISDITIHKSLSSKSNSEASEPIKVETQAEQAPSEYQETVPVELHKNAPPETFEKPDEASREFSPMKSLNPIAINSIPPPDNAFPLTYPVLSPASPKKNQNQVSESEGMISSLIARVDIWKTAKTAIEGFNQLTESQLSISKVYDENGNVSMLLRTESYSIESFTKR